MKEVKQSLLISVTNKLSFIDRTINSDDVAIFLKQDEKKGGSSGRDMLEDLRQTLTKAFGKRICNVIGLSPAGFDWN